MCVKHSGEEDLWAIANMDVDHRSMVRTKYTDGEILATGCSWYNLNSQADTESKG